MPKILQIVDSPWSIGQLCKGIRLYNPQIEWKLIYVPPRDIEDHLEEVREAAKWADLIDFQYWNVAWQLIEKIPELKDKKKILTHHNEKNILSKDWSMFDAIVVKTDYCVDKMVPLYTSKIKKIENVPDLDYFEWVEDYPPKVPAVGYAGRIVPWKGLKEVAKACYELGYPLYLMGTYDKADYWREIPEEYKEIMKFDFFQCADEDRMEFFKNITCYVGNSGPCHEAGTLPFLEAMACGVPVVTTPNGMAADIVEDEKDALIARFGDYEHLKEQIKRIMEDESLRNRLRTNAWQVIKNYNYQWLAKQYEILYNQVLFPNELCASVIIPATYDRQDLVAEIIKGINEQTYKNIEIVVVWDEIDDYCVKFESKLPVKQFSTKKIGYNLAMARNLGVIEAIGDYLVFCDSRLRPAPDAVKVFVSALSEDSDKCWYFGEKGGGKVSFVENFSIIKREELIKAGMFNERICQYGGMSQELRSRFIAQGFKLKYLPEAKAEQLKSSKLTPQKRKEIIAMKNILFKLRLIK